MLVPASIKPRQDKTESKDQGDAVMGAPEADQGVRSKCESDQAPRHFQIRVQQRVSQIGGATKSQQEDEVRPGNDHPNEDESKTV